MDKSFDFTPKPEYKCVHCGKAQGNHRSHDKACPIGSGNFPSFSQTDEFESSGKLTIKSKRAIAKYEEDQKRSRFTKELLLKEQAKIRAMTYEEVITAVVGIIYEVTGLGAIVERERESSANIHVTNLGGTVRLGYTSVNKYTNGSIGVGGTSAGCFMANQSDKDISNVIRPYFKELEERANSEKK